MLDRIRIVLYHPTGPTNVGAVSRAMANMGLAELVLVAPKNPTDHEQSIAYASHGLHVLQRARTVDTLEESLNDCVKTYATSSKLGLYRRQAAIVPHEAAREALAQARTGPVAIAFGPESFGFRNRELLLFDRIITIPADDEYPVLNLAAAVTIVCYEVRKAWHGLRDESLLPRAIDHEPAPDQRKQILFAKLFDALDNIGFFSDQSPDKLKYAIRHLFGRFEMTVHEADVMIGMAQQIRWYADHHRKLT